MSQNRQVGIFLFPDVEVLDFCGPFEVFSVTGRQTAPGTFEVCTIAQTAGPVLARNGLSVNPSHTFETAPKLDLLLIPGGQGTRPLMNDSTVCDWIARRAAQVELVLSVCTGALLLAKAGLLNGLAATTHHGALDLLAQVAPETEVCRDTRYIDNGRVITSAGIAAGIDMSLHIVERLCGREVADATARYMEYPRE